MNCRRAFQRRAGRHPDDDFKFALVVLREEVLADHHEQRNGGEEHQQADDATITQRCVIDQRACRDTACDIAGRSRIPSCRGLRVWTVAGSARTASASA